MDQISGKQTSPDPPLASVPAGSVYSHVVLEGQLEVISPHARTRPPVHANLLVVLPPNTARYITSHHITAQYISTAQGGFFHSRAIGGCLVPQIIK